MDSKGKLLSCLVGVMLFGSLLAGSTFALYQSNKVINNHLVTGEFKAGLYLTKLTQDSLDSNGLIVTEETDLTADPYTSAYEEGKGVNLVEYKNDIFAFDSMVPTMTGVAEFTIYNTGNVAFEYLVKMDDVKGYVYDEETGEYVESDSAALVNQIDIKINEDANKVVNAGSSVTFTVSCEFLDLDNNNDAMNQKVSFDISVLCTQVVKSA